MLEFEGKRLLKSVGVVVPDGVVVRSDAEVDAHAFTYPVAVKAQVEAGGRGKAGGVIKADDAPAAKEAVRRMLGSEFAGERPEAVLVEPWLASERELYLSVTANGEVGGYVVLYSRLGGIEVEEAAELCRYDVGPPQNFRGHALRRILSKVEADSRLTERVIQLARVLVRLAASRDCITVEINPLVVLEDQSLVAADAKIARDEWATFRSADIRGQIARARSRESESARRCLEANLMLVPLDGNVGLISGGAGMTMAVMDLIAEAGGQPACFLDCSANPTPAGYQLAFEMLDADPKVEVILVSIFGGATHMDRVARVMTEIMAERSSDKPVVFRLNGTHAEQAGIIFREDGIENHATIEAAVNAAMASFGGTR